MKYIIKINMNNTKVCVLVSRPRIFEWDKLNDSFTQNLFLLSRTDQPLLAIMPGSISGYETLCGSWLEQPNVIVSREGISHCRTSHTESSIIQCTGCNKSRCQCCEVEEKSGQSTTPRSVSVVTPRETRSTYPVRIQGHKICYHDGREGLRMILK
ncbi:AP-2 complex subunit sigma [Fusarium oxysporum f. sp. albedinis]|nr:AP-2 complex subunit sigma [Fusarium oxysporum f. sp. albedinis]